MLKFAYKILAGMQVLTTTGPEALQETGGEILILTDGVETEAPFVADVMEAVTVRDFEKSY